MRMHARDWTYIEDRLLAPATPAMEAHARLKAAGMSVSAERLMRAMQAFQDECRAVRHEIYAAERMSR